MRSLSYIIAISALAGLSLVPAACSDRHQTEARLLDSLDLVLDEAEKALELDIELFNARINELGMQRSTIINKYTDSMSLEFGQRMDMHRAIAKRYGYAVKEWNYLSQECPELRKQLKDLRNYIRSSDYDKETFKGYYRTERTDVLEAHARALQLEKEVYEIEPAYMRVSDFAQEVIQELQN